MERKLKIEYESIGPSQLNSDCDKINYYETIKEGFINNNLIDDLKAIGQHKLNILDVEVYFPYKPYQNQIAYMESGKNYKFFNNWIKF